MKALLKAVLCSAAALSLGVSMAACTSCGNTSTSSVAPSSMASSIFEEPASSLPSSSFYESTPDIVSDIESRVESTVSGVASAVTPTMSTDFEKIGALPEAVVKWGPGTHVDPVSNRTTDCEALQELYGEYNTYFIAPAGTDQFYLTFDEGYENGYTPAILDVLKEKGVSAVFFVTGDYVRTQPELIQRMIDEGHIVGNHSNKHKSLGANADADAIAQDIIELHEIVKEQFAYDMFLYRPPQGLFSEQTLALAQQMGYTTMLWSFAYADWNPDQQMGADAALQKTEKMIHDGGIYLLHAVSSDNATILGDLIDEVRARGLEICKWDL